jgi:hypothetical protein
MKVRIHSNGISRNGRLKRSGKNWCPACNCYRPAAHNTLHDPQPKKAKAANV